VRLILDEASVLDPLEGVPLKQFHPLSFRSETP
jgi:hypothetical protein